MMKKSTYISILILWGCNTLMEQTTPLEGDFYLQDGWLAFSSKQYDEADKHFNTAIKSEANNLNVQFLSYIGLGWTHIYKAHSIEEISDNGWVKSAGEKFDLAFNLLSEFTVNMPSRSDVNNLYAGLVFQRSYFAKQKSANGIYWETSNFTLNDTVRILYEESIEFSNELQSDFEFQYDFSLNFIEILLLRIENYIILGKIEEAISTFSQLDFEEFDFEVSMDCKQGVNADTIIECLCIVINHGNCPFDEE